jgi:hypothetical protein
MGDENTNTNSLTISSGDDIAEELKALEDIKKKIPSEHGGISTIAPAPQSLVTQINAPDIEEERRLLEEAKKGSPEIGSAPPVTLADTLKHVGYGNVSDELANLAREEQNPDVIHEFPQWFEKSPDQIGYLYQRRKNEAMGDVANKAIGSAITSTPSMIGNFVKGGIQVLGDATGIQLDELKHENDLTDDEKLARAVKSFYNPMQDVLEGSWRNLQRAKDHGTFVTDQYKVANGQMTEKEAEQQFRDREAINTHNAQFDATKPDSVARAIDYTRPLTQKAVRAMIAMQTASVDAIMAEHPEWTRDQAVNFKIDHDNLQSEQLIQNAIKEQNKTLPSDEQTSFGSLVNPLGNEFGWVNMGTHLAMNGAEATGKLLRFGGDLDKTGTMGEKGYQFAEGVASDAEKDVATPSRVQQAAESLANTIQKTGESVDVALNKLPDPIRTAVKAKLPSILTGAGLVGAGAVGAIEDPNNAVAGALKGLTLGSAVFAPRVLSDLLKADAKVAGGTGSMFKTAYDSPESALATKLFSYVPSRTIPVVNKVASQFIADKAKNFIRDGVHATTIATALGLASDKDAEQIGADVANGMLFIGGHGAIGSMLGKDPRQQIRDKRRQDYQNYQFLSGLDPADKEIVNDVSGWNNVVNHSQQKYDDAIKNYAEAYNNDPNSEDTKNLSKQVVRAKADLADKKGANFSTREAYKREILSILAEEERKVNGSLLPGRNVKFRFMTRDQIADQLQRGNNNMDRATALHYADNAGARYAANGQGVQPLVFDPMRDSVVLNMDKMRQVQADTGKTMAWVLRHEIAEQLMHTKQGQELFQPLSDSLFGKQILKPDGSYMMDGKGVYTPEMLNEQFINNYLGKKTPQEKVVWAKNNGLWDYQNDDFDKPKVAQYMQKEVLAEANAAGLMDTEARLDSPLENLRAWAVVNGENSRLARITQGIVGRGSRNPLKSDLTGVTYTPEHFSQVRNANIQLQKLNGAIDATEQAPAPKVTPKDMMNNRSLAEGLGKDDGVFKTTKVLEILDDKGNVVATQLVDPKTYEGEWAHDPADNKNVKVAGYGSTPDFINNQIIPQGGKARISSQIVYDKEGKPAINTPAEFKAHQKIRTDAIRNIFDTIDSGINGAMTRGRTGEYNYRGSITDNQFKALMSLPEDIMSYSEKKKLALVRDVINDPSGSTMIGLHSARLNARGRYQAFTPKIREERPFSIQFSKDGHFLPVTFNVTGARDKVKYIMKYQPSLLTLWGNDPNKFMEGLSQYMSNWQNDPVIKDASGKDIPIDPLSEQAARIRHENLDEDPQVALQKRYIYDAFMNTQPPKDAVGRANFNPVTIELPKVKRKDKTKEEKDDFQRSDPNTLIRSPRLDGYHDIARGNGIKFPFQYGKSIYNAMPDAQVPFEEPIEPSNGSKQPTAPQVSSEILKGIQAVHSPENAGFGVAFVPSTAEQTIGAPMAVNKANNPVGINIRDEGQDFTGQILRGEKTIETRDNPTSLAPYVGKRVGLISTGKGKAKLVGTAVVGEPKVYNSEEEFRADQDKHLVEPGSTFDIKTGGKKWGFPITDVQYLEPSEVTKNGIVSREITLPSSTPSAEQTKSKPITKGISEPSDEPKGKVLNEGDKDSLPVYLNESTGKPKVQDYDLLGAPFFEKNKPKPEDTTKPDYDNLDYYVTKPARDKINELIDSGGVDAAANEMVKRASLEMQNPAIDAGKGWYGRMRDNLLNVFGHEGRETISQLLGATSAQTPVMENFKQAMDAYEGLKSGRYDGKAELYHEMRTADAQGKLGDIIKSRGYVDILKNKSLELKQLASKAKKDDAKSLNDAASEMDKLTSGDIDNMSSAKKQRLMILATDMTPLRSNGKKFNANSMAVLKVLSGTWVRDPYQTDPKEMPAPKTPNFAGNLTGRTLEATIDVWAARYLRDLLYSGENKPWRIQPAAEYGVSNQDFALGQVIMGRAAKKLNMNPDDLQAVLWFAEKHKWDEKGWTGTIGAEKSSFDDAYNIFFPEGKPPLTFQQAEEIFAKQAKDRQDAKKLAAKASKQVKKNNNE